MRLTLVNGIPTFDNGACTGRFPGEFIGPETPSSVATAAESTPGRRAIRDADWCDPVAIRQSIENPALPAFALDRQTDRRRWLEAYMLLFDIVDQSSHAALGSQIARDPLVVDILCERFGGS